MKQILTLELSYCLKYVLETRTISRPCICLWAWLTSSPETRKAT